MTELKYGDKVKTVIPRTTSSGHAKIVSFRKNQPYYLGKTVCVQYLGTGILEWMDPEALIKEE